MAVAELARHEHPDPPFAIDLPAGAELGVMPGVLLVARLPRELSGSPFQSNLTVVAEDLPADVDAEAHAEASLRQEAEALPGWRLIDRAQAQVGEAPADRTLATYLVGRRSGVDLGRQVSITLEQWRLRHGARSWIVSASCETGDYGLLGELWTACAESLRPGAGAA
jgi:hypothetical protein